MVENEPDHERAQWLERLAAATEIAIARLRGLDDPAHMTLLSDLQAFRDRLATTWTINRVAISQDPRS